MSDASEKKSKSKFGLIEGGLICLPIYLVVNGVFEGASAGALVLMGVAGALPGLMVMLVLFAGKFDSGKPNLRGLSLGETEAFERQFMASRAFGLITIGGLMTATNQRLVFVPHRFNFGSAQQLETLNIPWSTITGARIGAYPLAAVTSVVLHGMGASSEKLIIDHAQGTDQFVVIPTPDLVTWLKTHLSAPSDASRSE